MNNIRGVEDERVYTNIYFDYVKYLNTLATGAIILEVSFLQKIFPSSPVEILRRPVSRIFHRLCYLIPIALRIDCHGGGEAISHT